MSKQTSWTFFGFLMLLALGHGIYWFVGGAAQAHSPERNAAVIAQIVVAGFLVVYSAYRRHRASRGTREASG